MWAALFLLMFFGLLAAGMPIFLVLGVSASILFFVSDQPLIGVAQKIIDELNSATLMALPLFVTAAAFMRRGGVAKALVDVASAWFTTRKTRSATPVFSIECSKPGGRKITSCRRTTCFLPAISIKPSPSST